VEEREVRGGQGRVVKGREGRRSLTAVAEEEETREKEMSYANGISREAEGIS
jgi:hypothetical protein